MGALKVAGLLTITVHLAANDFTFMGLVAALAIVSALLFLTIILVIEQVILTRRSDGAANDKALKNLRKWTVARFVKLTVLGVIVGSSSYVTGLIFIASAIHTTTNVCYDFLCLPYHCIR